MYMSEVLILETNVIENTKEFIGISHWGTRIGW